ncbi:hypothetical protein D3C71_1331400 [compost metagenome]
MALPVMRDAPPSGSQPYSDSTSATSALKSMRCITAGGVRAYSRKSSTICFSDATWLTMVLVDRWTICASAGCSLPSSFMASRSADNWMGVSGFLISCARRRATSPQATVRLAEITSVMSSNTTR